MRLKKPAHRATTAQLGALYPFAASAGLPGDRVLVGRDRLGGLFAHDPFELYRLGVVTNPNIVVLGQLGRGKSAFVKSYLYRQAAFGRRLVVLDPKGEYGPLAAALGARPIRLEPGGHVRLNPLDLAPEFRAGRAEMLRRRLALLGGIAAAASGRALRPVEHAALEAALRTVLEQRPVPTLREIVEALLAPAPDQARAVGLDAVVLREDGRDIALELRRLAYGELSSMFDGTTSPGLDLRAGVVVLDLSALYHSPALATLLTCAAAALESSWRDPGLHQAILVVDEAWAVLHNVGAARFFQASFKLARAHGVANIAVVHRTSDLASVGEAGSATVSLAEGLLSDCETVVAYAQAPSEVETTARMLDLDESEARLLPGLRRGVALWRVGGRRFVVEHRLGPLERAFVDTDAPLLGDASRRDASVSR